MSDGLVQRSNSWSLKRRVPARYAAVEPRKEIWKSLKTDSKTVASIKADKIWLELIEGWEAKLAGKSEDAMERFEAAQKLSDVRGFRFLSADEVAKEPLENILARVEAVPEVDSAPCSLEAAALLGAVDEPKVMLSGLVAHVEELSALDNRRKNRNQMRIWRTPRDRAVRNLIAAIGRDIPVQDLTAEHAMMHRSTWETRVRAGEAEADTANKDFTNMSGMLKRFYGALRRANPPRPYMGISIQDKFRTKQRKLEVPVNWITEKWLAPGALDMLNQQARDILLITLETGCRQSEIHDLPASGFKLEHEFPHVRIDHEDHTADAEGREIKNIHSVRLVPLVGIALAAARRNPNGFPQYRAKSSYSAAVNKTLRSNGLLPDKVTVGGVRHTWESRMKDAGYAIDDRGELMGHSIRAARGRETYGDALTLAERFEIANRLAFPVPEHLA